MNAEERAHIHVSKHAVSCIPCLLGGWPNVHSDYHHVTNGDARYGHLIGFPMCLWHHRGKVDWAHTMSLDETLEKMGPSYELHRKQFLDRYGTEMELVALNDYAIEMYRKLPWPEHDMPLAVMSALQQRHQQRLLPCS